MLSRLKHLKCREFKMYKVRKCGDGLERFIESFEASSPIGNILIKACPRGLHMVNQSPDINDSNFSPDQRLNVEFLRQVSSDTPVGKHAHDAVNWLQTYFHDLKNIQNLPLPCMCSAVENGSFHDKVWFTLARNIPPGHVISYSELAKLAGSQGAQQSVGTAMAKNPFQLIIPCHRVVKSGNKVGKYSSGCRNSVKIWLLQHEGLIVSDDNTINTQ